MNIAEMIKEGANVNITVTPADLKEFALCLMDEAKREEAARKPKEDRELTRKEVMEMLHVSESTLWQWEQQKYLVPARRVGRRPIYLESQIKNLK